MIAWVCHHSYPGQYAKKRTTKAVFIYRAPFVSKLFRVAGEMERTIDLLLRPKWQNIDEIFRQTSTRHFVHKWTGFLDNNQPDS